MSPNPQETEDLVTFTEEILNGKLYFLCSVTENQTKQGLLLNLVKLDGLSYLIWSWSSFFFQVENFLSWTTTDSTYYLNYKIAVEIFFIFLFTL